MKYTRKQMRGLLALMFVVGALQTSRMLLGWQVAPGFEVVEVEWAAAKPGTENSSAAGFVFDPNTMGMAGWMLWGLTEKQAQSVLKFRERGGWFNEASDLKKLYAIDEALYARMENFVEIQQPSRQAPKAPNSHDLFATLMEGTGTTAQDSLEIFGSLHLSEKQQAHIWRHRMYNRPAVELAIVDVNTANFEEFTALKGIGAALARRILAHREALGGFHHTTQLLEVFGIDSARLEVLAPQLLCDGAQINQLRINRQSLEELQKHPYISWRMAQSVVVFRERYKTIDSLEELSKLESVTADLLPKLAPYLNFSP